jgi:hypothetical protein
MALIGGGSSMVVGSATAARAPGRERSEADQWACFNLKFKPNPILLQTLFSPNTTIQGSKNLNKIMGRQGMTSGTNFVIRTSSNLKRNLN